MALTYDRVATALMWHDPRNLHWQPRPETPLGVRAEQRLERLRHAASLSMRGASMADAFGHLRALARERTVGTIDEIDIGHRLPLILAHGPSLSDLLPSIRTHRDRLCLIVPYRTAVHLAAFDMWADVVVLADRGPTPYRISDTLWTETPDEIRTRLARHATLVMDPFAPASIHGAFERIVLLEDGTGLSGSQSPLPFWGFALLTCLALPLARGAKVAAMGGIDLKAASGPARRTWDGASVHLDPRFAGLASLLEILASCDRELVDVSAPAIAKRHFRYQTIDEYAQRPVSGTLETATPPPVQHDWLGRALTHLLAHFEAQASVVATIRSQAEEGLRLTAGPRVPGQYDRIAGLLSTIERQWRDDPRFRDVLATMQPTYLMSLTGVRKSGVSPVNAEDAAWRTTKLICLELADLAEDHARRLASAREAAAQMAMA